MAREKVKNNLANKRVKKYDYHIIVLLTITILIAGVIRFINLSSRGFVDSDEFPAFTFLYRELPLFRLNDVMGSMWGRPIAFLLRYPIVLIVGLDYHWTPLFVGAFAGLLSVFMVFKIGEKFFSKEAGIVAANVFSLLGWSIYFSRNMKAMIIAIFFYCITIYLLMALLKEPKRRLFALTGLFAGITIACHPNTIPSAQVVLCIVFVIYLFHLIVNPKKRNRSALTISFLHAPFMFWAVTAAMEQLFAIFKVLPFFEVIGRVGYLANLIYHSNLNRIAPPTFEFYLSSIAKNGSLYLYLVYLAPLLLLSKRTKRGALAALLALFWLPMSIYVVTEMVAVGRNMASNLVPLSLIVGINVSFLLDLISAKRLRILLLYAICAAITFVGMYYGWRYTHDASAAHAIRNYARGGKVAISKPSRPLYHWYKYYFTDGIYPSTWREAFEALLTKEAEFLIVMSPYSTSAKEFLESNHKAEASFPNININGGELWYPVFNLARQLDIFRSELGISYSELYAREVKGLEPLIKGCIQKAYRLPIAGQNGRIIMSRGRIRVPDGRHGAAIIGIGTKKRTFKYGIDIKAQRDQWVSLQRSWRMDPNTIKDDHIYFTVIICTDRAGVDAKFDDVSFALIDIPTDDRYGLSEIIRHVAPLRVDGMRRDHKRRLLSWYRENVSSKGVRALKTARLVGGKRQLLLPDNYVPNRRYRVTFSARTSFDGVGRFVVNVLPNYWVEHTVQLKASRGIWAPYERKYSMEFVTPPYPATLELLVENIRAGKNPHSYVEIYNLVVEEIEDINE